MMPAFDIHQHITGLILAQLDQGAGEFELPWHRNGGLTRSINIDTRRPYQGVNVLALWAAGEANGFTSGIWGTYRQWIAAGAQVRRGEKASFIVFFKQTRDGERTGTFSSNSSSGADAGAGKEPTGDQRGPRLIARASAVFAAEQVDGYQPVSRPQPEPFQVSEHVASFVESTGANIINGGDRAFYRPSTDTIHLPPLSSFIGSPTSTAAEAYCVTVSHELVHWSSAKHRCDRELGKRFGDAAYAMEELVAELGAAFICADLGITQAPRPDHAQYLSQWLKVLRDDKRAIFTAASRASQAAAYLHSLQPLKDTAISGDINEPGDLG